jgi:hypothetical protein
MHTCLFGRCRLSIGPNYGHCFHIETIGRVRLIDKPISPQH